MAAILSACLMMAAVPFGASADGDTLTDVSFTYVFENSDAGSAEGVITFDFGSLDKDRVTSLKYYWVDSTGTKLSGYSHIVEFGSAYLPEYDRAATHNAISNAAVGYSFLNGSVIPFGAAGIIAELIITQDDSTTVTNTVTNGKYITVIDGETFTSNTLPQYKFATVDHTTDVGGKELYQIMWFADFHNYYNWADNTDPSVEYNQSSLTFINAAGTKGAPQGKAMYAVNKILESDPKSIGTVDVGDLINDASGGTGSKGYAARGDYKSVLATYYQAGLMDYFNFFAVGNHDLIAAYAEEGNDYFIDMLKTANGLNTALAETNTAVSGLPKTVDSYYYDFYVGDDHYIVLSAPHENPSALGDAQLSWFSTLLAADDAAGVRTFVACHEPLGGTGVYGGGYLADEAALKTILEENSANHKVYFFTGHTHISYLDNVQNVYLSKIGNVSYIGLPVVCNTATKWDSQGMQVKVYEDKVVFIGRQLYDNGAYSTDYLPSAMMVYYETEDTTEIPSVIGISSAQKLAKIGVDPEYPLSGNYVLTADIDLSGYEKWTPIGYSSGDTNINGATTQFTGTFDGNGHTISNMNCLVDSGTYRFAGLFGSLKDATVKNLCLKDCKSYVYNGNKTSAAGMLTGGTVCSTSNPYSTVISNVSVIGGWVKCAKANASNPGAAGGLVGFAQSGVTIKDCYVDTDVTAVLNVSGTAESYQIGAGGFVGMSYDAKMNATDCIFAGTLDAEKHYGSECTEPTVSYWRQNAMLGFNNRAMSDTKYDSTKNAVLTDCYYTADITVNTQNPRGADGTAKTVNELALSDLSDLGLDETLWVHNGFTPILKVGGQKEFVSGDATADGITDIVDLIRLKKHLADSSVSAALKSVDLDGSKTVDTNDVISLRKLILGIS